MAATDARDGVRRTDSLEHHTNVVADSPGGGRGTENLDASVREARIKRWLRQSSVLRTSNDRIRSVVCIAIAIAIVIAIGALLLYYQLSDQMALSRRRSFLLSESNESLLMDLPEAEASAALTTPIFIPDENITEDPDLIGLWLPFRNVDAKEG
ncbi:uncharacterized protein LOC135367224 [Ornithodoros turicata]|uniref:uncharacterized protein LOC135367224 n=1 Tax=Ornithodoros turicata TaxID=34597 RepID=UPI00313A0508